MNNNLSAAPGTPQTPTKAIISTIVSFVVLVIASWVSDDGGVTSQEVLVWIMLALGGSGITGGATYTAQNKPK